MGINRESEVKVGGGGLEWGEQGKQESEEMGRDRDANALKCISDTSF